MQIEYIDGTFDKPEPFSQQKMNKKLTDPKVKQVHVFRAGSCAVCGNPVHQNNSNQIVYYCSKECRRKRHNRNA